MEGVWPEVSRVALEVGVETRCRLRMSWTGRQHGAAGDVKGGLLCLFALSPRAGITHPPTGPGRRRPGSVEVGSPCLPPTSTLSRVGREGL